jgi:chemotaxis protein methyltransferase CheR
MDPQASPREVKVDRTSFAALARLVHDRSGIHLRTGKEMLVVSRLTKQMRQLGMTSIGELVEHVRRGGEAELGELLDAISTNVTEFFRHPRQFAFLAREVRRAVAAGERRFRIWSSACSSGEEPYSIAMTVLHAAGGADVDVRVLATDISTRILRRAAAAEYPAEALEGLPRGFLGSFFEPPTPAGTRRVAPAVRRLVRLRHYNLSGRPLPLAGALDAVFCRNVMIYFDRDLRQRLVDQAARVLRPGGHLVVGQSESLSGLSHPHLVGVEPSIFVRR